MNTKPFSTTYDMQVQCSNCGYEGTIQIPKGYMVYTQKCPNCTCKTLLAKIREAVK